MAKRIICAIISLVFIVSMVVIPASSYPTGTDTTENGYPIPDLCTRTNEPDVTNYCFELKRVLPSKVVKDGVIDVDGGEYYPLGIPRDEIILKGSNDMYSPSLERSQAMKASVEAYVSWDYQHGVNFAVQYTSPETPVQQFSSLYYDGRVTPLPGSTKDNPLYNDSFNDDGTFRAIEDNFWANTAFSVQFGDRTGRAFYYVVGRNTETGEYLMGHYFFSDLSGNGWGQYGYDPTYIPVGGRDFIITYGPDNLVTMECSVPFSTILGRDPEDGEKIGFSLTLTQGTNPPGFKPDDPENPGDPWSGDLVNNAAILLGNNAGFQSLAAKPTRTKTQKVFDPVTDEQITKKTSGNLPMVAIFNTTAPEGGEEPEELACTGSLTLNDDVEINVAVNGVSAELANGGYVVYNRSDEEEHTAYFDAAHLVEDGKYKFTVASCDAIHLADPVYFSIFDASGEYVDGFEYSAKDYCDTVVTDPNAAQGLKDLCSALMAYAYYADSIFLGAPSADYTELYGDAIVAVTGLRPERMGTYQSEAIYGDPVTGISASLALKSKTELSIFVKGVSELHDVAITVGGEAWDNYEVVPASAKKSRVIIKGLRAVDLQSPIELVCAEASVEYSPMACAKALVAGNTDYADVCRALYRYSTAAINYFAD